MEVKLELEEKTISDIYEEKDDVILMENVKAKKDEINFDYYGRTKKFCCIDWIVTNYTGGTYVYEMKQRPYFRTQLLKDSKVRDMMKIYADTGIHPIYACLVTTDTSVYYFNFAEMDMENIQKTKPTFVKNPQKGGEWTVNYILPIEYATIVNKEGRVTQVGKKDFDAMDTPHYEAVKDYKLPCGKYDSQKISDVKMEKIVYGC